MGHQMCGETCKVSSMSAKWLMNSILLSKTKVTKVDEDRAEKGMVVK